MSWGTVNCLLGHVVQTTNILFSMAIENKFGINSTPENKICMSEPIGLFCVQKQYLVKKIVRQRNTRYI